MTDFASPACVEALRYWIGLSTKYQAHPPGIVDWGTTPRDFLEQKVAMIWTTTGNLSNIRTNAKFPFGVAMLPADKRRGSPTGGGNFYLFRSAMRRSGKPVCGSCVGSAVRNARHVGASTPAMSRPAPMRGTRRHARLRCRLSGRCSGTRPIAIRGCRVVHARQPARHPGAERRDCRPRWSDCKTPDAACRKPRRPRRDCCVRSNIRNEGDLRHDPSPTPACRDRRRARRTCRPARPDVQKLTFYYPIAVGGPLQAVIDGYCKGFQQETGIAVEPVYSGDYSQTLIKALAAIKSGAGPTVFRVVGSGNAQPDGPGHSGVAG